MSIKLWLLISLTTVAGRRDIFNQYPTFLKLKPIFLKSPGHNMWSDLIKFVNQFVALLPTQFQQSCN
jgi:hypothetical protein